LVAVGDEVPVGTGLLQVDTAGGPAPAATGPAQDAPAQDAPAAAEREVETPAAPAAADEEPKNLVGYGASSAPQRRRRRRGAQDQGDEQQVPIDRILAKPPVRKLARDLGVALHDVLATGPEGT